MSRRYTSLIALVLLLFVLLYGMLCFYSRLATDDFYFIWDVQQHGIIKGVSSQYMEWCGRYAATFLMDAMYAFGGLQSSRYLIFPLLSLLLLAGGVYRLLQTAASAKALVASKIQLLLLTLSFTALLFFLSIDIGETWFWYCSLSSYLWSVVAFVWGLAFLAGKGRVAYAAALACFIYVGGASEVYSVIYGLLLIMFLLLRYRQLKSRTLFFADALNRRILLTGAVFALAFLVFLVAPGNYLRDQLFPERAVAHSFFIAAKSVVKFSFLYLPSRLAYIIAFATPFMIAGRAAASSGIGTSFALKKIVLRTTSLFIALLLLFFYMVAYVMVETGPPRVWFIVSLLLAAYCCFVFFCTGYAGILKGSTAALLQYGSAFLGLLLMVYHLSTQLPLAARYAQAADTRTAQLDALKQRITSDTVIALRPLPPSGMLYSAEIQPDTSHFSNKELRLAEGLPFHVIVHPAPQKTAGDR